MAVSTIDPNGLNIGQYGNRNLLINSAMQVAQRGTSVSVAQGSNAGYQTVDRFRFDIAGTGVATVSQSTDAPAGFKNSHKIEVTTTNASPTGTDYNTLQTRIEGQNAVQCGFGTSDAQQMTLSFYVKSSLTGLFGGSIANAAANRSYPFGYTINSANTWERKTITFTADTTGTWATDNTTGPKVLFGLGLASYFLGTDGAWTAADKHGVTGQINLFATNGATWQITGVQLEVGEATPFEHRSYGQELALCMRYTTVFRGTGAGVGGMIAVGASTGAGNSYFLMTPQVPMRATPSTSFSSLIVSDSVAFDAAVNTLSINYTNGKSFYVETAHSSLSSVAKPVNLRPSSGSFGELILDAEL